MAKDKNIKSIHAQKTIHSTVGDKLSFIRQNEKEPILFPYLQKLFLKKGFENVSINHGPTEFGKDLVFFETNKLGKDLWYSVVVKNKDAEQRDIEDGGDIYRQIMTSFKSHYVDSTGNPHQISQVLVVINGKVTDNATRILEKIEPHLRNNIEIWNFERLEQELEKNIKNDFLTNDDFAYNIKRYNRLWSEVCKSESKILAGKREVQVIVDERKLVEIYKEKQFNRYLKNVSQQEFTLRDIFTKAEFNEIEIKLIIAALKDTTYFPQYYPELVNKIENTIVSKKVAAQFEVLKIRNLTLKLIKPHSKILDKDSDSFIYEEILFYAFSFQFLKLKQILNSWNPSGNWIQKKAAFISIYDKNTSKSILIKYLENENDVQERYYSTELLNLVNQVYPIEFPVDFYSNQKIKGLYDYRDYYLNKIIYKELNIKPYGYNGTSWSLGGENVDYELSVRFIQFVIETGLPFNFGLWNFIDAKKWFVIFKNIFNYFPFPTLFYSIQCSEKEILKRIGQEYAYSNSLIKELPKIQIFLLKSYLSKATPNQFKNNILSISQELFIAVPSNIWEPYFMKIWQKIIIPNFKNIESHHEINTFISNGLIFIKNRDNRIEIIKDCLNHVKQNVNLSILFLYKLAENDVELKDELSLNIKNFLENIDSPNEFFIAGNISNLLYQEHLDIITEKVKILNGVTDIDYESLFSISYFARLDNGNSRMLIECITNHPKLWDNGILEDGAVSNPTYLSVIKLSNYLDYTNIDCGKMFEKLKLSFFALLESRFFNEDNDEGSFLINYTPLLNEMYSFLINYEKFLSSSVDFNDIKQQVYLELNKKRKFTQIKAALLSDDSKIIVNGISQLIIDMKVSGLQNNIDNIEFVIFRVLHKKIPALIYCIDFVLYCLQEYDDYDFIEKYKENLILILHIYQNNVAQKLELEVPKVYSNLIMISDILNGKGISSENIDYWIKIKDSCRFNLPNKY